MKPSNHQKRQSARGSIDAADQITTLEKLWVDFLENVLRAQNERHMRRFRTTFYCGALGLFSLMKDIAERNDADAMKALELEIEDFLQQVADEAAEARTAVAQGDPLT